jgi:deoxyadenosine/deoxycytidine kinase
MSKINHFIEICGCIASGKTALSKNFGYYGYTLVYENFHKNPFLKKFYQNSILVAFETELTFLLQHYNSIKLSLKKSNCACDFSLVQDLAYADLNLTGSNHKLFCDIEHELRYEIGFPAMLIHLICPANILFKRIHDRNRAVEQNITLDYLLALNEAIEAE